MTNYEQWQLEKYGNIVSDVEHTPEDDLFESGIEELNRLAEWMNLQHEKEMHEHDYQWTHMRH